MEDAWFRPLSAEFPNDNPELHLGAIWTCPRVCGPAEAEVGAPVIHEPEWDADPIEIVDSLVLEDPIEIVPPPPESTTRRADPGFADADAVLDAVATAVADAVALPVPVPIAVAVAVAAPGADPATLADPVAAADPRADPITDTFPFCSLLQTLSDVAVESSSPFSPSEIAAALAADPVASAWRAILNGESDDFSLCASPLDEWASAALARLLDAPHKAAALRRELRARGVAAFGLVEAAA